jgi:2-hydroxychromene-2-carboxylate isomerase
MTSKAPIDFYFEFSSPYGYIASQLADDFEKRVGRPLRWRPFLLGPVFKITGQPPLVEIPMKGEYSRHDFLRSARLHKVPYKQPSKFPIGTVAAMRAFYWLDDRNSVQARALARALYKAYFVDGIDISAPAAVIEIAKSAGIDATALATALEDPALKERAKEGGGQRDRRQRLRIALLHRRRGVLLGRGPHADAGGVDPNRRLVKISS